MLLYKPLFRLLQRVQPVRSPLRRHVARAAVAVVARRNVRSELELMFIERARREGDPWSGDMAFPGGRLQHDDPSACGAAIRETREEIGVDLDQVAEYVGRLPDLLTRRHSRPLPMIVSPYLFRMVSSEPLEFTLNHEVAEVHWVPLHLLEDRQNREFLLWKTRFKTFRMPSVRFQERYIWGLSFRMVESLLRMHELRSHL